MTKPTHNHPTRDIKPPGICPGCDNARKDWFKESERTPEPIDSGYHDRLMERVKAEANAHLQASLEWAVFRRSDPADGEPFDSFTHATKKESESRIERMYPSMAPWLETRCRLVSEWVKA